MHTGEILAYFSSGSSGRCGRLWQRVASSTSDHKVRRL